MEGRVRNVKKGEKNKCECVRMCVRFESKGGDCLVGQEKPPADKGREQWPSISEELHRRIIFTTIQIALDKSSHLIVAGYVGPIAVVNSCGQ